MGSIPTPEQCHDMARNKGWWEEYPSGPEGVELTTDQLLSKIALIHSELSEAVEAVRDGHIKVHYPTHGENPKPEGMVVELADAVIRTYDLCIAMGLDIESVIRTKFDYNATRPRRHGGKQA